MNVDYVFAEPISVAKRDIDSEAVVKEVFELLENHETPPKSGRADGRRIDLFPELFEDDKNPHLGNIVHSIVQLTDEFRSSLKMKPLIITSIWININGKGGYNTRHCHPGSTISGAFYIKVPEDSESPFILTKSRESTDYGFGDAFEESNNPNNINTIIIPSEEGKLILFPSYIEHEVPPNQSDDHRISLSFNTGIMKNEAS